MEQFNYNDLNAITQFRIATDKMNTYLDYSLNILKRGLPSYEFNKILNLKDEEFIIRYKQESTELNIGFTWSDEINLAIEINVDPNLINTSYLVENDWLFKFDHHNEALFFKYTHLKDLIIPMRQLDQEFRIQDFIQTFCDELIEALVIKKEINNEKQ